MNPFISSKYESKYPFQNEFKTPYLMLNGRREYKLCNNLFISIHNEIEALYKFFKFSLNNYSTCRKEVARMISIESLNLIGNITVTLSTCQRQ